MNIWKEDLINWLNKGNCCNGSSAGAMVFGEKMYDPEMKCIINSLNIINRVIFKPHYNPNQDNSLWGSNDNALIFVGLPEHDGKVYDL